MNPKSLIKYLDPYKELENYFLPGRFANRQIVNIRSSGFLFTHQNEFDRKIKMKFSDS